MKDVKSKSGETEKQPREYAPDGPVRLAPNAPDSRGRLNGDGSKSAILAERPVYVDPNDFVGRLDRLERAVRALEERARPMLTRTEPGPIDLDLLVRRVAALEAK